MIKKTLYRQVEEYIMDRINKKERLPGHQLPSEIELADKYFESLPINSVVSENYKGTYEDMSRLIKEGHKRIAFIESDSMVIKAYIKML